MSTRPSFGDRTGPHPAEERRLVKRMRAGDAAAFEAFTERYVPALYRFAGRRLGHDRELTREIVQGTVCKVIEKLDSYRGEAALFTWLCACCRNEIAAHFRSLGRRPQQVALEEGDHSPPIELPSDRDGGPEERFLEAETAELVHAALDLLPPHQARALEWRYLEGASVGEIARRLETSYKAAESLLSRGRTAFRESFEALTNEGHGEPATATKAGGAP